MFLAIQTEKANLLVLVLWYQHPLLLWHLR
jgi:hypothetical protein